MKQTIIEAIMLIFFLMGVMFFLILSHEYVHYFDLKDYVYDDSICLMTWPLNNLNDSVGYYSYYVNTSDILQYEQKHEFTEIRAMAVNILIIVFVLWVFKTHIFSQPKHLNISSL